MKATCDQFNMKLEQIHKQQERYLPALYPDLHICSYKKAGLTDRLLINLP